jgi:hypothetical protein
VRNIIYPLNAGIIIQLSGISDRNHSKTTGRHKTTMEAQTGRMEAV